MSNSIRWTAADLERYEKRSGVILHQNDFVKPTKNIPKNIPNYPDKIAAALRIIGISCVREYKFLHDRRFKFDIAIPELHIAIEYEGIHMQKNTTKKSRHQNGAGYAKDCKKYNLAVMHGWKLLRFTTADTRGDDWEFKVAGEIELFIKQQKEGQ